MAWSPDGERLASYAVDGRVIEVWDKDGALVREIRIHGPQLIPPHVLDFVAGHRFLIAAPSTTDSSGGSELNDVTLSIIDTDTGLVVRQVKGPFPDRSFAFNSATELAVSPDQSLAAVVWGSINGEVVGVYSTLDWHLVASLNKSANYTDLIQDIAFSPDGRLLAIGRFFGRVEIYEAASWRLVRTIQAFPEFAPFKRPMTAVLAFSPDSALIAVGANQGGSGWVLPNGRLTEPGHGTIKIFAPPLDPVRVLRVWDGTAITSAWGFGAGVWGGGVQGLAWSPENKLIAFLAAGGQLHVWDPSHPDRPYAVVRVGNTAISLAFSPDGEHLAVSVATGVALFQIASTEKD